MAESYPNRVENTVGKGEIARYEQFLLFQHCFQKACFPGASKGVIVWKWVKEKVHYLPLDGILQIPNLSSLGILGTEPEYFPTQQPLL